MGRWWCHLVSLLLEEPSQESDLDKLLPAVQQFMEQSTLGDFAARLQLLKAFHCHTLHLPQSQHHDNLQRLLWNAYIYFSQFSHPISVHLRSKRAPIEKKLKEIVKISRWTDTNYWALRQTTMKTHRTLHKHMKEFQAVLVEPSTSSMTVSGVPKSFADEGVPQACRWFKKAQKLSKELLLTAPYPHRIHSLFQFASDITDTTKLVQSQNVPAAQSDKKQRKSQVKHLLQCKRKAVADTFRSLTRIGLSYRTGMAHQRNPIREAFLAAPLDIEASIASSNK
ncbi:hypothetical protein B566_EDAN009554 [Ephemera danica]|nr:hypothetical protein B566_EDAN009554 [Ephemera danica]